MRTYVLTFSSYEEVLKAARKLRKRGVSLIRCVMIVSVEHWNSVKDFMNDNGNKYLHNKKQIIVSLI